MKELSSVSSVGLLCDSAQIDKTEHFVKFLLLFFHMNVGRLWCRAELLCAKSEFCLVGIY